MSQRHREPTERSARLYAVRGGRPHDLPVAWDGQPVTWFGWKDIQGIFICPDEVDRCDACWSSKSPLHNRGSCGGNTIRLDAYRCPDCMRDVVLVDGAWWVLDDSDYGSAGSVAPVVL